MRTITKYTAALTMATALAVAAATPSEARNGRNTAAIVGFGVGALVGAAAASAASNAYYGPGYYYGEPGYDYQPGYTYAPAYGAYGYSPTPYYGNRASSCAVDQGYGRYDYSAC
jgi:hypothetical protein